MPKLKYVGGILPSLPSNRFVNSVFINLDTNDYYIQEEENESIYSFKEIDSELIIVPAKKADLFAEEKDNFIYSFVMYNKDSVEVFYGDKCLIESDLLLLINSNKLNVHSKLLISSFLNLYGRTLKLVEDSNRDFEKKGISQRIEMDSAFITCSFDNDPEPDILEVIYERYIKYKSISQSIQVDDIAFIKDDIAYFDNKYVDAKTIVNKNSLKTDRNNKLVSEIITICTQKHMINIEKFSLNNDVYEFLLESEYFVLEQHLIEQYLSETVKENKLDSDDSVLDIGIEIDKKIYGRESDTEIPINQYSKSERSLIESFKHIVASAENFTSCR